MVRRRYITKKRSSKSAKSKDDATSEVQSQLSPPLQFQLGDEIDENTEELPPMVIVNEKSTEEGGNGELASNEFSGNKVSIDLLVVTYT